MDIGMCYDLRPDNYSPSELVAIAEFDVQATIDAIAQTLLQQGHTVSRIGNGRDLARSLCEGKVAELYFNISEGAYGRSRESQVPALLELFDCAYTFSDPCTMNVCLDKALTKRLLSTFDLPVGACRQLSDADSIESFFQNVSAHELPLFLKPGWEGTSKGVGPESVVSTVASGRRLALDLLDYFAQPVIVEPYLPGTEYTVGLIGSEGDARVLGTLEVRVSDGTNPPVYGFIQKEECESRVEYVPVNALTDSSVAEVERLALRAYRAVGCRDAGRVDVKLDGNGDPFILEVNPLPGLHPTHSDLPVIASAIGLGFTGLIETIVKSAGARGEGRR